MIITLNTRKNIMKAETNRAADITAITFEMNLLYPPESIKPKSSFQENFQYNSNINTRNLLVYLMNIQSQRSKFSLLQLKMCNSFEPTHLKKNLSNEVEILGNGHVVNFKQKKSCI